MADRNINLRITGDASGAAQAANATGAALAKIAAAQQNAARAANEFRSANLAAGRAQQELDRIVALSGRRGGLDADKARARQALSDATQRLTAAEHGLARANLEQVAATRAYDQAASKATTTTNSATKSTQLLTAAQAQAQVANKNAAVGMAMLTQRTAALVPAQNAAAAATAAATGVVRANTLAHAQNVNTVGAGSMALVSFSQLIQDSSQFGMGWAQGIRAITNNIQTMAASLAFAAASAGGFTKAIKLMFAAMRGPLGILFAISLATSALELFSNWSQKAKKDVKDLADGTKDAASDISDLSSAIAGLISVSGTNVRFAEVSVDFLRRRSAQASETLRKATIERILAAKSVESAGDRVSDAEARQRDATYETARAAEESAKTLRDAYAKSLVDAEIKLDAIRTLQGEGFAELEESASGAKTGGIDPLLAAIDALRAKIAGLGGAIPLGQFAPGGTFEQEQTARTRWMSDRADGMPQLTQPLAPPTELRTLSDSTIEEAERARQALLDMDQSFFETTTGWFNNNKDTITQFTGIIGNSLGTVGTSFMQLAQTGEGVNKKMFSVGKAFAIANATINTAEGVTKALAMDGPLGIIAGASVAAAGAAQIAVIAAAQPGSSTVRSPGGSGGSSYGGGSNTLLGSTGTLESLTAPRNPFQPAWAMGASVNPAATNRVSGELVGSGRTLVGVIKEEIAAQKRMGVRDPLGVGA